MSKEEIKEYKEFEDKLRNDLEQQFTYYITIGDKFNAHETLKELMAYRLIPDDDFRADKNTKLFSGQNGVNVKDRNTWGMYDYRRTDMFGYLPKYLFCNLKMYEMVNATVMPHMEKRVEGNYSGDIKVNPYTVPVKVRLVDSVISAENTVKEIANVYKQQKKEFNNIDDVIEEARNGVIRLYRIEAVGSILSRYKTIGYIITKINNSGKMIVSTVIRYESIYSSWIDVESFVKDTESAIYNCIPNIGTISHIFNVADAMKIQSDMVQRSNILETGLKRA